MNSEAARPVAAVLLYLTLLVPAIAKQEEHPAEPIAVDPAQLYEHQISPQGFVRAKVPPQLRVPIKLQVVVGKTGEVESAHALNGFPNASVEAEAIEMKKHFKPFEDAGHAVRASLIDYVGVILPEEWASPRVPFPTVNNWDSLRFRIERLPCYGPCPVYSVEVHGNGDVFYEGTSGILFLRGHHQDRISHDAVARLLAGFREADYLSLKDEYSSHGYDSPTYITSLEFDGHKKRVLDFEGSCVGLPESARQLEDLVDQVAQTGKWLKGTGDLAAALLREHWDFKANTVDNDNVFAVSVGKPDLLSLYFEHGFPPLESVDPGDSPLVSAAGYGSPALLIRLIGNRKRLPALLLTTALTFAAAGGDVPTMRFLMQHGASPNGRYIRKGEFESPLLGAVYSDKVAAVDELLKLHPDVNRRGKTDEDLITVLLTKTFKKSEAEQILTSLIKAGANVNARDSEGQTPLFNTGDMPNPLATLMVLAKAGADVNARDKSGQTPLMNCYDADVAKALINLGADVFARDKQGRTALRTARERRDQDLIAVIESAMAAKS